MGFMDSYKRLEKLCGEVMNDDRKVSAYIDEMYRLSNGFDSVEGWREDLKQLKHYRRVRNQIVHDPGCTEENMCELGDAEWIDQFYWRIMNGTDPLTKYRKKMQRVTPVTRNNPPTYRAEHHWDFDAALSGCMPIVLVLLAIALVVVVLNFIY